MAGTQGLPQEAAGQLLLLMTMLVVTMVNDAVPMLRLLQLPLLMALDAAGTGCLGQGRQVVLLAARRVRGTVCGVLGDGLVVGLWALLP